VTRPLRIGTRGSRLALAQADWVKKRLVAAGVTGAAELVVIRTSGDRFADRPLAAIGGKGLFVKEIEEALLAGTIDIAVHSLKDLPAELAAGLVLAAVPEREDPRDALLCRRSGGLAALPHRACVGTSSPRRAALLRATRPDVQVEPLRGNVDTRLRKLEAGEVDAVVLAQAGLHRLGIEWPYTTVLAAEQFVPAIGQGALAIECRAGALAAALAAIDDGQSHDAIRAERAFLLAVGGSCVTPLAAHGAVSDGVLALHAVIAAPSGERLVRGEQRGAPRDAEVLGRALAERLLADGGTEILNTLAAPFATAPKDGASSE
jgi:hydroxymethylbilane synthase